MGFFTTQTKVIDLENGNTVTLRKLAFADMMALWSAPELYSGPSETGNLRFNAKLAKLAIASWDGPDFEGRGVSPENIDALPPTVMAKIMAEAAAFSMMDGEEKN
jgi:hypothetical protein